MNRLLYILGLGLIATAIVIGAHQICWGDNKIIVLNIFQGIYASTLVVLIFEFLTELKLYRRLNFLSGQWTEHKINDRTLGDEIGKATITYNGGNSLTILVNHNNRQWVGEILVDKDCPNSGSIAWSYHEENETEHEFGFKQIIIPTERNKNREYSHLFIYFIPTNKTDGYDNAVLVKKKASR